MMKRQRRQNRSIKAQSLLRNPEHKSVTERRRPEEELKKYSLNLEKLVEERTRKLVESEKRFRDFADLLPMAAFEIDAGGNITFFNQAASAMTGISPEEAQREFNALQAIVREEHNDLRQNIRRTLSGEKLPPHEYTIRRKDGSTFPVMLVSGPITREGKIVGIRGVAMDITERRRMEQELKESEERFRGIAERSIDGIFEMDLEGRLTYVSPSVERGLGYKPEEVVGSSIERYLPESEISKIATNIELLIQGKNIVGLQGEMLRKDGTRIQAEVNASPIFKDGKIVGVQGVIRDITERQRAEEELRQSERRFRELAELLPQIVFETDESGVFTFVNHTGLVSTGYTEDDFRNPRNFFQLVPPNEHGKILESLARRNEGKQISLELNVLRKDGSVFPALVYAGAIVRDRKVAGFRGIVVDITEQKRTQEELRTARQRLEHLVTTNPAAIYSGRPLPDNSDFYLTYISDRVTSMLGFDPQQYLDLKFWRSRLHPQDRNPSRVAFARILNEGKGSVDYRFLHLNGTYRWVREEAVVTYDSGLPVEVYGYITDITELKRSEEAQRESETRYRRLFENSPVALFEEDFSEVKRFFEYLRSKGISDLRGYFGEHPEDLAKCASMVKILDVNQTTLNMYGASSVEELRGELRRLFTREFQERFTDELVALNDGKTRFESDFENQALSGETKRVSLILTVVPGYEDTLSKVLVSLVDLTEQMKIQEDLRSAKDRLEYVIKSSPAVIYIAKPLPDFSDYYTTYKSENVVSMTGFESQEFIGEKGSAFWASRVHPDDIARYRAGTTQFWREGHQACEYRFLHKNGTYRWIREEAKVIRDSGGNVRDIIGYWTDVTNRKRMEEELLKSQRLAAIGETASMVAHDLRNPLQGITGAIHLLKQESLTTKERDEMMQVIERNIAYSDSIVRELTDYSAEIQLNLANTNPRSIMDDALRAVRIPPNVTAQDLSEDQPTFKGDVVRLRRVFVNLIENAIDAMPQGGRLVIRSKRSEGAVEIIVSDSGTGMAEKVMANLWKPFQTTKAKGLGLGLSICKRIVDAHEGTISVDSRPGVGTTITTILPLESGSGR